MEVMICGLKSYTADDGGGGELHLATLAPPNRQEVANLQELLRGGKRVFAQLKEYKPKRSLEANAYAWVLIGKLANVLRADKEEIHLDMLKRYGQIALDREGNPIVFSVKSSIDPSSFSRYLVKIGESELNGETFCHYKGLKGSREFDRGEMSIYIEGIISEAKELGIETLPDSQLEGLVNRWQAKA